MIRPQRLVVKKKGTNNPPTPSIHRPEIDLPQGARNRSPDLLARNMTNTETLGHTNYPNGEACDPEGSGEEVGKQVSHRAWHMPTICPATMLLWPLVSAACPPQNRPGQAFAEQAQEIEELARFTGNFEGKWTRRQFKRSGFVTWSAPSHRPPHTWDLSWLD